MFKSGYLIIWAVLVYNCQAGYPVGLGAFRSGGQFLGIGGPGGVGMGYGRLRFGVGGMGFGGPYSFGTSQMEGSSYGDENKNLNDIFYHKNFGNQAGQSNQGQSGFTKGEGLIKDSKGNFGYYNGANGGKNIFEDGSSHHGQHYFGKEGLNRDQENAKKGHKKGHTMKGYKTSHQSDESSNSEEIYDEASDEGGKKVYSGKSGKFGENDEASYKGEKEDAKFNSNEAKTDGKQEKNYLADKAKVEQGKFGAKTFNGEGTSYGVNNDGNIYSNGGHQEANKFYKHYPIY